MKNKDFLLNLIKSIAIVIFYLFFPTLIANLFAKTYHGSNLMADLTRLEIYLIIFIIIIVLFNKELRTSLPKFFKNFKTNIKSALKNWGKGFLFMIICNVCILVAINSIASNEAANRSLITSMPISSILFVAIMGPMCEELVFRANFRPLFKNVFKFCLISGIIFGSMHLISSITSHNYAEMLYIFPYSGLGYFMAKAYSETDNIYTSMTIHIMHNSLCIALIYLATYLETLI